MQGGLPLPSTQYKNTRCEQNKIASNILLSHVELCTKQLPLPNPVSLARHEANGCSRSRSGKEGDAAGGLGEPWRYTQNYNPGDQVTEGGGTGAAALSSAGEERQRVWEVAFQRHHFSPLISLH